MSDFHGSTAPGIVMTARQGLYDPAYEHDACGIGFVAHIHGVRSRDIVAKSLQLLVNLSHRSAANLSRIRSARL